MESGYLNILKLTTAYPKFHPNKYRLIMRIILFRHLFRLYSNCGSTIPTVPVQTSSFKSFTIVDTIIFNDVETELN